MTSLIHIVGQQGVGKSTLAQDIIAGLNRRGKTAMALIEKNLQMEQVTAADIEAVRHASIRRPYTYCAQHFDYLIAEHIDTLCEGLVLVKGDVVITIAEVQS